MGLFGYFKKEPSIQGLTWQEQISAKNLTAEQFTRLYQQALKEKLPEANIQITDTLALTIFTENNTYSSFLENIWRLCKDQPNDRAVTSNKCINTFLSHLDNSQREFVIDPNLIIPVLKDEIYLQQANPAAQNPPPIYSELFMGVFHIVYGLNLEDRIQYLPSSKIDKLDIPTDNLREFAISNLKKQATSIQRHEPEYFFVITSDGAPASSIILIDSVWDQQEAVVTGNIVACVPSTDLILFTGSDNTEGIKKIQQEAQDILNNDPHVISDTLLIRKDGQWTIYNE